MSPTNYVPITRDGFADELDSLENRWGKLHAGFDDVAVAYEWFAHYPREAFSIAVMDLFAEGRQGPPSPSLILKWVKAWAAQRGSAVAEPSAPCDHPHYAIKELRDGSREGICGVCRHEITRPPGGLLCDTELDDIAAQPTPSPY